jgi:hypothetical protein
MKKKIVIWSILAVILMLSMPFIANVQARETKVVNQKNLCATGLCDFLEEEIERNKGAIENCKESGNYGRMLNHIYSLFVHKFWYALFCSWHE